MNSSEETVSATKMADIGNADGFRCPSCWEEMWFGYRVMPDGPYAPSPEVDVFSGMDRPADKDDSFRGDLMFRLR